MSMLNIRLTEQIEQQLAEEARRENKTRSEIARDALNWYLTEGEKKRFMDQLLEEARTAYADNNIRQEALDLAEEFLSLDGEIPEKTDNSAPADPPNPESSEKWWK
jgi:metal-responsive CopG/Arc/MetJ family transcriptional regulator